MSDCVDMGAKVEGLCAIFLRREKKNQKTCLSLPRNP